MKARASPRPSSRRPSSRSAGPTRPGAAAGPGSAPRSPPGWAARAGGAPRTRLRARRGAPLQRGVGAHSPPSDRRSPYQPMATHPSPIELLELDIDLRLADLWAGMVEVDEGGGDARLGA